MEKGNRRNLYLVTLSVSMAMTTLGVASGWPTVALGKFSHNETNIDTDEGSRANILTSIPVGFAVGSIVASYIADKFGRRITILASALPFIIGSIIVSFAVKAWQVAITTAFWSCGTGLVSTIVNVYFSEIADKDVRGTLSLVTGFMFKFGLLAVMCGGPFVSYEVLNYIMLVLPVFFGIANWWIPETPYFFLKNGNVEGARRSLRLLREYKDEKVLEEELLALQANVKNEMKHSSSFKELFVGVQYRKAILIAVVLKLTSIMTGTQLIKQYLILIIQDAKLKIDDYKVTSIYVTITLAFSVVSSVLGDRVGRRPLLIFSYLGTAASLFAVGCYFFLKDVIDVRPDTLTILGFMPLTFIILAHVITNLGFGSIIFIIFAEIFPINVKAIAMTYISLFGSALGIFASQMYPRLKSWGGLTTVFWSFAGFALLGSVFSYFKIPETIRKDLRDIQTELQGANYDAVAVDDRLAAVVTSNDENKEGTEMEELKKKDTL